MASDFATVTTSLRHVLDWTTFINTCYRTPKNPNSEMFDWSFVQHVAKNTNMIRFLDAINSISVKYLGYPKEMFPVSNPDDNLSELVIEDILNNDDTADRPTGDLSLVQKIRYGITKTLRLLKNRWKYNVVYDENIVESFFYLASNRLNKQ